MTKPTDKHWVRFPGPGEMRGEGIWIAVEDEGAGEGVPLKDRMQMWEYYHETGFLPTHIGSEPPADEGETEDDTAEEPPRVQ